MDLPRHSRHYPGGPAGVLVTLALVFLALVALRGVAVEATNYLWFGSLHLAQVWSKMMWTRIDLALLFSGIFLVACWASLAVVGRSPALPPPPVSVAGPEQVAFEPEEDIATRYRSSAGGRHPVAVRVVTSVILAILVGAGASAEWNNWTLFANSVAFGRTDPLFHRDIGFFVFKLPFLSFLAGWAFVALLVLLVVTAAALYLNGGIRLQGAGQRVTPQAKAQLSVLLGLIALAKSAGYYLSRFGLDMSNRGYAEGAFFTDVHARLPALNLLVLVSLVSMIIFVVNIGRRGWVLPVIGLALWAFVAVVVGAIYPAIVQNLSVAPNQAHKEARYIGRNIAATRTAMGIAHVATQPFADNKTLSPKSAAGSRLADVSVWDPALALASFKAGNALAPYFDFNSAGVDRYNLGGTLTPTIMAVRNLDLNGVPGKSWVNQHLQYTHGEGAVLATAYGATAAGKPNLVVSGLPSASVPGAPVITQPQVYFGEGASSSVIANTAQPELDYPEPGGAMAESTYKGAGGVAAGGLARRAAFALRFGSLDTLTSGLVTPSSRVMFVRNVEDRAKKAAPFLAYDANPYPVIVNGQIDYVIDAYTISANYPYAQQADVSGLSGSSPAGSGSASGLATSFNYVRNSVKVVVNAYSGAMSFYVVDPKDPIVRAYERAFPDLFTPGISMPDALKAQLRYPQDLFTVQAAMLGHYRITTPASFFAASNVWAPSQAPGTGPVTYAPSSSPSPPPPAKAGGSRGASGAAKGSGGSGSVPASAASGASQASPMAPSYQVSQLPGDPSLTFNLTIPYVTKAGGGGGDPNLSGLLVARSTPGAYGDGQLEVYEMPTGKALAGPAQVGSQIHQDQAVSARIAELNHQGDTVALGTIEVVPVGQSLLWVRPLYVSSGKQSSPRLAEVIAAYGSHTAMATTFAQALASLLGQAVSGPGVGGAAAGEAGAASGAAAVPSSVKALISQAEGVLGMAQAELRQGDLSAYQADVVRAQVLLAEAGRETTGPASPGQKAGAGPGPGASAGSHAGGGASGAGSAAKSGSKTAVSIGNA